MAEFPSSWRLTTRKNKRGTLDVMGKDDIGRDYKVRETDHRGITEKDVAEIAAVDRERTTAAEFVGNLVADGKRDTEYRENQFHDDLTDAAGAVVHAGLEIKAVGYSKKYARNYDNWIESIRGESR